MAVRSAGGVALQPVSMVGLGEGMDGDDDLLPRNGILANKVISSDFSLASLAWSRIVAAGQVSPSARNDGMLRFESQPRL